jgi:hypothetical protein
VLRRIFEPRRMEETGGWRKPNGVMASLRPTIYTVREKSLG